MEKQKTAKKDNNSPKVEENSVFEWIAHEYIQHEKGKNWYLIAAIIVVISIFASVISGNWSLALVIITFVGVYIYTHQYHPPKEVRIRVTERGIHVGSMFFNYSNIKCFWIFYDNGLKTLNLSVVKRIQSEINIQLNHQDPVPLRQYLVGQITELEGKHESLGDVFLRMLKL